MAIEDQEVSLDELLNEDFNLDLANLVEEDAKKEESWQYAIDKDDSQPTGKKQIDADAKYSKHYKERALYAELLNDDIDLNTANLVEEDAKKEESWQYAIDRNDSQPTGKEQIDANAKSSKHYKERALYNELLNEDFDQNVASLVEEDAKKEKKEKPWQYLIDQNHSEPNDEEQRDVKKKHSRNVKNKNNVEKLEPFSNRDKWALYLYNKNYRASLKLKKEAGTYVRKYPYQYLIALGDSEPTVEEQKAANTKYSRNFRKKKSGEKLELCSIRDKWAYYLYDKNNRASVKRKKEAGNYIKKNPYQYFIDRGDSEPTEQEQSDAHNKHKRNQRKKKKGEKLEPFSDRDKWALYLHGKNYRASVKTKKEAGTLVKENPWQYLIDKGDSEPTNEEQRAAKKKYNKNSKKKKKGEKLEPFSDRDKWAIYLHKNKCKKIKEVVTEETFYDSDASTSTINSLKFISDLAKIPENKKRRRLDQTSYPKNLPKLTKVIAP